MGRPLGMCNLDTAPNSAPGATPTGSSRHGEDVGELNERLMSHYTVRAWKVNLCSTTRRSRIESLCQV